MSDPTVLVKRKDWTIRDVLKSEEADVGPTHGRTAGSWVYDLAALKKLILLCPFCTHKFNPAKVGYRKDKEFPHYIGKCDGCGTLDIRCSAYFHEEIFTQVRSTAEERRELQRKRERAIKRGYFD